MPPKGWRKPRPDGEAAPKRRSGARKPKAAAAPSADDGPPAVAPAALRASPQKKELAKPDDSDSLGLAAINAPIICQYAAEVAVIKECAQFAGISELAPLDITANGDGGGGRVSPYTKSNYENAMKSVQNYVCGYNFFFADPQYTASRGVPLNGQNIEKLTEFFFERPAPFPMNMTIAMKTGDDPEKLKGRLQCVTPFEMRAAFVKAIARDCEKKDIGRLQQWRAMILSTTFEFLYLESEADIWRHARQLRENLSEKHATMRLSAMAQVFELLTFKTWLEAQHGKMSARAMADAYREKIKFAETSDCVSDAFVDSAITIEQRLLSIGKCKDTIIRCEATYNTKTPFDSIYKLQAIVSRAKTPALIEWCVVYIADTWDANPESEPVSLRFLLGTGTGAGGKGLVDLLVHKYTLKRYFQTEFLEDRSGWQPAVKSKIRAALDTHESYREHVGFSEGDLTWRAGWDSSAEEAWQLMEACRRFRIVA